MTCSITGSSCSVTNDSDTRFDAPPEDVSFCCANGLPTCGLERIQDPTYRIERIELSGLRETTARAILRIWSNAREQRQIGYERRQRLASRADYDDL